VVTGETENGSPFLPAAAWPRLQARSGLLRRLRRFFDDRDFVEVETPLLSADTVVDRHLDPFPVTLFQDPSRPDQGPRFWLQTSPEFCMKRLLAAGAERIYQVTRAFRGGERGPLHNPEFTIVEWYRVGDGAVEGRQLLAELACEMLGTASVDAISYRDAFQQSLGLDPLLASQSELARAAAKSSAAPWASADEVDRDTWLDFLLATCVQNQLGRERPVIVYDFPPSQAGLSRVRRDQPPVAERFELYFRGVELANGYHELLDADELLERSARANQQRVAAGKYSLPEQNRLLPALRAGLAPCAGAALGFDRLVMLATGAATIDEVLAFPIDRA
jgi:lysyl-tRNA synthetase class 2